MLPPALKSILDEAVVRFRQEVVADITRNVLPDLLAAETLAQEFAQAVGRAITQAFVEVRTEQALARRAPCACGRTMAVLRRTRWQRKTMFGEVTVSDPYVYCRICTTAARPLHAWLGTDRETWSLLAEQAAVDLVADESCEKAVSKLERHHPGVKMGRTTALRLLHKHGARAREFIDRTLHFARGAVMADGPTFEGSADELEVEFDGGMIPVATLEKIPLGEGEAPELTKVRLLPRRRKHCRWEEVKAGLVQKPGHTDRLYTLRPTGALEAAFQDLHGLACLKGWTPDTTVRGIADGAKHIRPRMAAAFEACSFKFILDRPHCKEHLTAAGTALGGSIPVQEWARDALAKMEVGGTAEVVAELRAAHLPAGPAGGGKGTPNDVLRIEANYFERNADAVSYAEYRALGWSTASSEIESAHGHLVQTRLKIGGAWWHPDEVDDILAIRMLRANGWWDEYWTQQQGQWSDNARKHASTPVLAAS